MQHAIFLVLASHLFTATAASTTVGVVCSSGLCNSVKETCRAQHENELDMCFPAVGTSGSTQQNCYSYCTSASASEEITRLYHVAMNITVRPFAQSPRNYGLNISWYIPDYPVHLEGFEVRVTPALNSFVPCYKECIHDPDVREVTLRDFIYMEDTEWTIQVISLPLPPPPDSPLLYTHSSTYRVPTTCQEIDPHDQLHCGPPMYSPVPEVAVTTTPSAVPGEMDIHLLWKPSRPAAIARGVTYPTSVDYSIYPDSHVYYLEIAGRTFLVQNTTQATITGLNISKEYDVYIQSYVKCSGLDLVVDKAFTIKGCSDYYSYKQISYVSEPSLSLTVSSKTATTTSVQATVAAPSTTPSTGQTGTTQPNSADARTVYVFVVLSIVFFLCTLATIVIIAIFIRRFCASGWSKPSPAGQTPRISGEHTAIEIWVTSDEEASDDLSSPKVLLIYSLISPPKEIEAVLHHVAGGLHQYGIEVEFPENCTECIAAWVERQCHEANRVLCVCNEAFLQEFDENGRNGTTFVSALRGLTYSYNNQIRQTYGIILPKESYRKFIPHGYLKGASEFVLDPKTVTEKVALFVKGMPPRLP